jgi:cation:H+ antiporter
VTTDILLLFVSLLLILGACEIFTNAVEWLGHRLNLAEGAVGSVLAAVGTALPETMIPVVAILFGGNDAEHHDVGIGAILGAPFMLATLAMFVNGVAILVFRRTRGRSLELNLNASVIGRDLTFFLVVLALAAGVSFVPHDSRWIKALVALALAALYALYVRRTLLHGGEAPGAEGLPPLRFAFGRPDPRLRVIVCQVVLGLAAIIGGAHLFVSYVTLMAHELHVSTLVLSLIIAPIATELPEKFNSVLWVRQGKDTLAMGNITGAMVFQSAIPPAIGICLTKWELQAPAMASVIIAVCSALVLVIAMRVRGKLTAPILMVGGLFYVAYLVTLVCLGRIG